MEAACEHIGRETTGARRGDLRLILSIFVGASMGASRRIRSLARAASMKLSTRLLVPLLPTVAGVMLIYATWAVWQRQSMLLSHARSETQAYATALSMAIEYAFRDGKLEDVQDIIDEVSREPKIYGILVYDPRGEPLFVSAPLERSGRVAAESLDRLLSGEMMVLRRTIGEDEVYSVLRPIPGARGHVAGILEVAQPLSFVEAERSQTTKRFILNTVTLLAVLSVLILWLVRRSISDPLDRFLTAIRALGQGEFSYRVKANPAVEELSLLADEVNRMAGQLEGARSEVIREAEERIRLERRLRESEKLAAIGNLATGVAHQIAAPLNVIGGRTQKLLKRGIADPVEERNLQIITEQIERITTVVRSLLNFARRPEPRIQPIDLARLVDEVVELLESEFAREGVRLHWSSPGPLWVRGDHDLLHQVLVNLLVNALEALERTEDRRVEIRTASDADQVALEVEDSGPGIPRDVLDRIFEPFFTTKAAGTGLGLAIARSIVQELGGQLEAQSGEGGGAEFRMTLPAAERQEPAHV